MKVCCKCDKELPLDAFHVNTTRKDGHSGICKECEKEYKKKYYSQDPEKFRQRVRERRDQIREWYREYKKSLRCGRCGEDHPACLQFHHTCPDEKELSLSQAFRAGWSLERLQSEIAKCEVLCSNCHFKEHYTGW